jgi:hypothetical protein
MQSDALNETRIELYKQTEQYKFVMEPNNTLQIAYNSQPFFADIDGDLK